MRTLVFDIETAEDQVYTAKDDFLDLLKDDCRAPENWKDPLKIAAEITRQFEKKREQLALSPRTGRICAIAWTDLHSDADPVCSVGSEDSVLHTFSTMMKGASRRVLAGFNVRTFDIPFLSVRCALHGIELPVWWPHGRDYRYVADARDVLEDGKLADWLHRFGLPAKTGVGSDAGKMSPEELAAYVTNDVRVERLLLRRLERVLPAIRDNRLVETESVPA